MRHAFFFRFFLGAALALAGCSGAGDPVDGGDAGGGGDGGADAGDAGSCGDTTTDPHHCGTCANDCAALAGVDPSGVTCGAGACVLRCLATHGDCDGLAANGCEADLTAPATCGACATSCGEPTPVCTAAGAGYACASGCGGATPTRCATHCADTTTSTTDCGGCGTACSTAHVTAACVAGSCETGTCDAGFADCNADLRTDGCETPTTTTTNCGGCGLACPAPSNGSATCDASGCGIACDAGYLPSGSTCIAEPPSPRQTAPLSTATVTSRRPTLRWVLAAGTDGADVELCTTRDCATVITSFDVTGSSGAPAADLPVGVVFWRLRGRTGAVTGPATSATWQFTVGPRTAAVDGSWGTTLDPDGDGYADVLVGAPEVNAATGAAYLYRGGATGLATTAATTLDGPDAGGYFGFSVASAGDVDGDGFCDVVVGAEKANSSTGAAYVYLGGATGLSATPATSLVGLDGADGWYGLSVASAGDVNGDGYGDVVVAAHNVGGGTGRVYVYLGGATGLSTTPASSLVGPDGAGAYFGVSVAGAGDVNGDGYADLVVGSMFAASRTGHAHVYLGSATGIPVTPTLTLVGPDAGDFGRSVASADDVNGDGYADVVVGAPNATGTGRAYVFVGGATGLATTPAATLPAPDGAGSNFGFSVASAGDVDGDGYGEVVVGAYAAVASTGRAHVFAGSAAGTATTPATSLTGPDVGGSFGRAVARGGDIDGDHFDDVLVGAYGAPTGAAYVYLGSSGGTTTVPATSLVGPVTGSYFGRALASAAIAVCATPAA